MITLTVTNEVFRRVNRGEIKAFLIKTRVCPTGVINIKILGNFLNLEFPIKSAYPLLIDRYGFCLDVQAPRPIHTLLGFGSVDIHLFTNDFGGHIVYF